MLSCKIKDVIFNNPILVASGTYGYGNEVKDLVDVSKLGGIVTKSVTLHPREGNNPPRIAETTSGMLNSIGLANPGADIFCSDKIPYLNSLNTKVIINIAGSQIADYLETLQKIETSGCNHIGYEINISCPNVKEGGMEFGVSPKVTEELTYKMRQLTDKLLIMKLSPNVTDITEIAKAAENGGADAVSAINTVIGMSIDIKTRKSKLYTNIGGLSGPAIKPIAIANIHKLYNSIKIPIIGIGGISSANDVLEFILAGAHLVQVGTYNYINPNAGVDMSDDLSVYCKDNNFKNISELRGKMIAND